MHIGIVREPKKFWIPLMMKLIDPLALWLYKFNLWKMDVIFERPLNWISFQTQTKILSYNLYVSLFYWSREDVKKDKNFSNISKNHWKSGRKFFHIFFSQLMNVQTGGIKVLKQWHFNMHEKSQQFYFIFCFLFSSIQQFSFPFIEYFFFPCHMKKFVWNFVVRWLSVRRK